MITEDYVSFETARLLKEKGFNWRCHTYFITDNEVAAISTRRDFNSVGVYISAPTLQMVMKWLRVEHNLFIEPYYTVSGFRSSVTDTNTGNTVYTQADEDVYYDSPEASCESIIQYCLENLI